MRSIVYSLALLATLSVAGLTPRTASAQVLVNVGYGRSYYTPAYYAPTYYAPTYYCLASVGSGKTLGSG
jgi:hypothetical protein